MFLPEYQPVVGSCDGGLDGRPGGPEGSGGEGLLRDPWASGPLPVLRGHLPGLPLIHLDNLHCDGHSPSGCLRLPRGPERSQACHGWAFPRPPFPAVASVARTYVVFPDPGAPVLPRAGGPLPSSWPRRGLRGGPRLRQGLRRQNLHRLGGRLRHPLRRPRTGDSGPLESPPPPPPVPRLPGGPWGASCPFPLSSFFARRPAPRESAPPLSRGDSGPLFLLRSVVLREPLDGSGSLVFEGLTVDQFLLILPSPFGLRLGFLEFCRPLFLGVERLRTPGCLLPRPLSLDLPGPDDTYRPLYCASLRVPRSRFRPARIPSPVLLLVPIRPSSCWSW